jgi:hypothetical protein
MNFHGLRQGNGAGLGWSSSFFLRCPEAVVLAGGWHEEMTLFNLVPHLSTDDVCRRNLLVCLRLYSNR